MKNMNMNSSLRTLSSPNSSVLRRPRASLPSKCLSRPFSQSRQHARMMAPPGTKVPRQKSTPAMSMNNRMKDAMTKLDRNAFPDDLGLLPGTFVRPRMKDMPSLFTDFKRRWKMEWTGFKSSLQGFGRSVGCVFIILSCLPFRWL